MTKDEYIFQIKAAVTWLLNNTENTSERWSILNALKKSVRLEYPQVDKRDTELENWWIKNVSYKDITYFSYEITDDTNHNEKDCIFDFTLPEGITYYD